jgi:hypothetical protein
MTRVQDIRYHDDGSIDFDFYRAYAVQLSREQRVKIARSILSGVVNRALALMSRVNQRRRTEPAAARWEPLSMNANSRWSA